MRVKCGRLQRIPCCLALDESLDAALGERSHLLVSQLPQPASRRRKLARNQRTEDHNLVFDRDLDELVLTHVCVVRQLTNQAAQPLIAQPEREGSWSCHGDQRTERTW